MPILDLDLADHRLAYARIFLLMAVPRNTGLRNQLENAIGAVLLEALAPLAHALAPGLGTELAEVAASQPTLRSLWPALRDTVRRHDGSTKPKIAATVLATVLKWDAETKQGVTAPKANVGNAIAEIRRQAGRRGFARTLLLANWTEFRGVSPIWYAHLVQFGCFDPRENVSLPDFLRFLSIADALRKKGEALRTGSRETQTLLDPDETWTFRLPSGMALENVDGLL